MTNLLTNDGNSVAYLDKWTVGQADSGDRALRPVVPHPLPDIPGAAVGVLAGVLGRGLREGPRHALLAGGAPGGVSRPEELALQVADGIHLRPRPCQR